VKPWLLYSLLTLVLWGFWGFMGKASSQHIPDRTLLLLGSLGFALTFPLVYVLFPRDLRFNVRSIHYYSALFSGLFAGIGVIFFYRALTMGDASKVVAFTAMYPLITVILSLIFLHESITIYRAIGIMCALAAAVFLSL
jgi:transporter family protein